MAAYIPTNVISITDGQIFLESELFNSGVRPAINVGISVSRVGGNAQLKAMKKTAGPLRTDQAEYRDLEAFVKFGSDLDAATQSVIDKGRRNVELLKQGKNTPMPVQEEIAVIYAGTQNLLRSIPVDRASEWEGKYLDELRSRYADTLEALSKGTLTEKEQEALKKAAEAVSQDMMA